MALVERSVLTAGSSWHAVGGFHAVNANPNMAILQAYTIDLLLDTLLDRWAQHPLDRRPNGRAGGDRQ